MSYPNCVSHALCRKKKVESFIIPPTYFRVKDYSIKESKKVVEDIIEIEKPVVIPENNIQPQVTTPVLSNQVDNNNSQKKVSAFSLSSIKGKKDIYEANKLYQKVDIHLPNEAFTEIDMLLYWNKYAQKLSDRGHKIMESLMLMNVPKLENNLIIHELPNEGSRLDFDNEKLELLGFLRSHLKNHDLKIQINVNETVAEHKFAFTDQDKYERLLRINSNLELFKKTFDLDF